MKYYQCDQCKKESAYKSIKLIGMPDPRGDVLMPVGSMVEKHFCGAKCFYHWSEEILKSAIAQQVLKRIGN